MSSRCALLLQYFGERHILLKDDWLNAAIDFLHSRIPQSKRFSDEKFASVVLDQWTCSNFPSSSFPVFASYGISKDIESQNLQIPIVCQINGLIDVGSPYYQQYCHLSGNGNKEDNSGFDKVFHEKEDDIDQKPSRLLKLTLIDGENTLHAIEFWKCPQLSIYIKPGAKILIEPPCAIRKGTFLLKPNNCKILGGEVLPLLNSCFPVEQYSRILNIKKSEEPLSATKEKAVAESVAVDASNSHNATLPGPSYSCLAVPPAVPGPSVTIRRYFQKKPHPLTSSITKDPETRDASPDLFDRDEENDQFEDDHRYSTSRKLINDTVLVSTLLSRKQNDTEDFEMSRRLPSRSPRKRHSIITSSSEATRRSTGLLTSRRADPMDEILENMIEKGEEPVNFPKNSTKYMFEKASEPPKKKIKPEPESDDEIEIIELVTPPASTKSKERPNRKTEELRSTNSEEREDNENQVSMTSDERAALSAFSQLKLSSISECTKKMKYSIGSRRFYLLAFIEDISEPLRVVDNMWTMKVTLKDETGGTEAFIDNQTLQCLIGYTCEEAIAVRKSSDLEKRKDGKRRLEALELQLQRLDLIFEIEFFAGGTNSYPVIRSMKTLAEQIDIY